jgi:hypothetical protein
MDIMDVILSPATKPRILTARKPIPEIMAIRWIHCIVILHKWQVPFTSQRSFVRSPSINDETPARAVTATTVPQRMP